MRVTHLYAFIVMHAPPWTDSRAYDHTSGLLLPMCPYKASTAEESSVLKVVLAQQKGGAAKTTLCVHLAVAAEQTGLRTAIIDTDPQGSASGVWGEARGGVSPPVAGVIAAELREALEAAENDGYDVVFVDTAPHTAPAIEAVAQNVDLAIVPVQPSVLDVAATQRTIELLKAAKLRAVAVLTRGPSRRDEETAETERTLATLGLPMLKTWMGERKIYRRALTQGQAVAEFDPKSKAAAEIRSIWKEIEEIVRPTAADTAVRPRRRKAA